MNPLPTHCEVAIVGAGPAGLALAAELQRHGVTPVLLERANAEHPGSRAIGVHAPTLAALAPSGVTQDLLRDAVRLTSGEAVAGGRRLGSVDFGTLGGPFPFVASLPQARTESALRRRAPEPVLGAEVVRLSSRPLGVRLWVQLADGMHRLDSLAVVVAAGAAGRELCADLGPVRARALPDRYVMSDVTGSPHTDVAADSDVAAVHLHRDGVLESFPLPGGGRRLVAWAGRSRRPARSRRPGRSAAPGGAGRGAREADPAATLRDAVRRRTGDAELAGRVATASEFGIRRVLLHRFRAGRVMAIGDTAHEVSPIGGQGMNLGLLDAVTLAPVLAGWLRGDTVEAALDRWAARRRVAAVRAARFAGFNTRLGRPAGRAAFRVRTIGLRVALAVAPRAAARAFGMGFDPDAPTR